MFDETGFVQTAAFPIASVRIGGAYAWVLDFHLPEVVAEADTDACGTLFVSRAGVSVVRSHETVVDLSDAALAE
jgi:hypothetical protein